MNHVFGIARRSGVFVAGLALAGLLMSGSAGYAQELHKQIDKLMTDGAKGAAIAPVADDATFVRRVYLDLAGRIPSKDETKTFLADKASDKRAKLVDTLLTGKEYPTRMQSLFNAMLMERRGENPEWSKFLEAAFAANEPWDKLAQRILDPDASRDVDRGAAFFYTKRLDKVGQQETDYPGLTRDVGRLFLGMDLQCAQCHNHLFIEHYKQQDFQGLYTVYQNTFIRSDVKFPAIGEKPMAKKIDFMSVFDKIPLTTGPRIPGGKEIAIPTFEKDKEYLVPPDRKTNFPGEPRFSALEAVARELAVPSNQPFVDNIVNRLWFVMMGRGLVMPLDQYHFGNPPTHPEVMKLLREQFVAHKCDMKWLLRELALTDTYQRSTLLTSESEAPAPETYRIGNEKRLSAEQIMTSVIVATGANVAQLSAKAAAAGAKPAVAGAKPAAAEAPSAAAANEKLRAIFVKAFANPPQDPEVDFAPSLKSALFVLNSEVLLTCLTPEAGNLVDRLTKLSDPAAISDELYLCILTRTPTDDERQAVADYLTKNAARRPAALTNLAWSLLASTEFCLNH
ncbi:MAG: DUF1549 and DUF1553 domain-containing protein [Planctomycetia bacterium]|nr:DUF1549 and DUF1553 domain-containing protein [Planctomycetia bacterium]